MKEHENFIDFSYTFGENEIKIKYIFLYVS